MECFSDSDCPSATEWSECELGTQTRTAWSCVGYECAERTETQGCMICTPGDRVCVGQVVEQCSLDGKDWAPVQSCAGDETCVEGECVALGCDDNNPCTLDYASGHECVHEFMDGDSDGVCDAYDKCPEIPASGYDGCPQGAAGWGQYYFEQYGNYILFGAAGAIALAAVIIYLLRRRRPAWHRSRRSSYQAAPFLRTGGNR